MHFSKFNYYLNRAQAHPGVSVKSSKQGLDLYRDFMRRSFAPGVAFVVQLEDQGHHNVWVYYTMNGDEEILGFKCGDAHMERYMEGQERFSLTLCKTAAAPLPNKEEVAGKLNRLIGAVPQSAPCDFWLRWRREAQTCAHVDTALAYLRDQEPNLVNQLRQAYKDAYPTLALAA